MSERETVTSALEGPLVKARATSAGVRGLDHTEQAGAVQPASLQEGLERLAAEVGVDGHRVREWGRAAATLQVRGRIRARGRTDVAALRVRDHHEVRRVGVGTHLL